MIFGIIAFVVITTAFYLVSYSIRGLLEITKIQSDRIDILRQRIERLETKLEGAPYRSPGDEW